MEMKMLFSYLFVPFSSKNPRMVIDYMLVEYADLYP